MSLKEKITNAEPSDRLKNGMTDEEVNQIVTEAKEDARERLALDEAIKHCEEVAYQKELESGFETDNERYAMTDKERIDCKKCAEEHRQLAEWLKELKEYKDARVGCEYCKHNFREQHERPCSLCKRNFMDMFEREVKADGNND